MEKENTFEIEGYPRKKQLSNRCIDLTNQRFEHLLVLYPTTFKDTDNSIKWLCQCDCDNKTLVLISAANLRRGRKTNCGCITKAQRQTRARKLGHNNLIDLTGQKFNKLTVLERATEKETTRVIWKCQCDCGNITYVTTDHLRSGHTKSCGCNTQYNLLNTKVGKLTVIEKLSERTNDGRIIWKCQCDCGNFCNVPGTILITQQKYSCGCELFNASVGEHKIATLLKQNNIKFIFQKLFNNCVNPETKGHPKFDFYMPELNYIIEFDGEQHFNSRKDGWYNEENFFIIQKRDKFKNQWCKDNNIPLIRIPYTYLKDLCIEDLLLETSKFIIN